jgi:hypothetical protein
MRPALTIKNELDVRHLNGWKLVSGCQNNENLMDEQLDHAHERVPAVAKATRNGTENICSNAHTMKLVTVPLAGEADFSRKLRCRLVQKSLRVTTSAAYSSGSEGPDFQKAWAEIPMTSWWCGRRPLCMSWLRWNQLYPSRDGQPEMKNALIHSMEVSQFPCVLKFKTARKLQAVNPSNVVIFQVYRECQQGHYALELA